MKVRSGMTRIVFIFDSFVIKIPKIPLLLFFSRFFKHSRERAVQEVIQRNNINFLFIVRYFLMGFIANRVEYSYSKEHPAKEGIIPINRILLWCILIQPRGEEVFAEDTRWKNFFVRLNSKEIPEEADVARPENYSYWKSGIYLHDYGSPHTVLYLNSL